MTTIETILHDLQQVPPQHLEQVHQVVKSLMAPPVSNEKLVAKLHEVLSGADDLSDADWDDINGHMRKVRAELFTRPNPFLEDDAHAA